jgi:transposase
MAYLKPKKIHGQTYWYIVESRRVNGQVKTVTLAYLGKADDILSRWQQRSTPKDGLKSYSHGAVAVMLSLAKQLGIAEIINSHVSPPRRGTRERKTLSVGETLVMATIGRALYPTSKRRWASWARRTTLGQLCGFDPAKLTSQYFWDQMDRLKIESIVSIEAELSRHVVQTFGISTESLYYDVTNFFTFIDSRNDHCDLPQRGKNKQKRNDLRQFQIGMLVSRDGWVPLMARLYRGNHNDVSTFPEGLIAIRQQCKELSILPERVTLVMDKGNISNRNWRLLDQSGFGYVTSLPPGQYTDISTRSLDEFSDCLVPEVGPMKCLRTRASVAGKERTVVVLDSPSLRDGQLRGLNQQLQPVLFGLSHLEHSLASAKRRRQREQIERQAARILQSALARRLLRYTLTEDKQRKGHWQFDWWIDMEAYRWLRDRIYGRRVLVSNHRTWLSEDVIRAYWGQSEAELVFRQMKDPEFLALRPQFHWTDQKIQVHSFCCVVGYLLAALVRRHARQMGYTEGLNALLERLTELRIVLRSEIRPRAGRRRIAWQLEESDAAATKLYRSLVLPEYTLGTTLQ